MDYLAGSGYSSFAEAVRVCGGKKAAARNLEMPYSTFHGCLARELMSASITPRKRGAAKLAERLERTASPTFDKFPKGGPEAPAIIRRLASEARLKAQRRDAEKWFRVHIDTELPIGITWFGDPHLGTSTNWERLERDIYLTAKTPGLYGANLGDSSNNWVGRLTRLYADESASRHDERKLIRWFLADSGITWLVWLMGNHDEWEHGAELIRAMDIHGKVPMLDWETRFRLIFKGRKEVRVHAAHDLPGHSIYNPTHSHARAVRFLGSGADLYIAGHRHTFGIQQFELPEANLCPVMVRAAGYKVGDPHARRNGFPEATQGASVMTIIDPNAGPAGRVLAFADIEQGARVLRALRGGK